MLYAIFVMDLVENLEGSGKGVVLGGAYCGMLMFVDDMAMLAGSEREMEGRWRSTGRGGGFSLMRGRAR